MATPGNAAGPSDELRPKVQSSLDKTSAASAESKHHDETKPAAGSHTEMPATLGRYRVLKKLGGGGMGSVYLVENTELQREEALKVPHFDAGDDPQIHERFLREARSAAKLDHPNLCQVYDVGVLDGIYFLTMRYLKGKPLSDYVGQQLPVRRAVEIVAKLAQALETAHAKGVIHRDLKPNNIIMCAGTGPTVMDFGLAKQLMQKTEQLTQVGTMLGTPSYMPPEQVKGELDQMGPASDVYSLGVILFELLTGSLPFRGATVAVLGQILYGEAPLVSQLRPGLPPQLDVICRKAMAKQVAERYPSMKGFATILINFLKTLSATEATLPPLLPATGSTNGDFQAPTVALPSPPENGPKGTRADNIFQANTVAPPRLPTDGPRRARTAEPLQANTTSPGQQPELIEIVPLPLDNTARPARAKTRSRVASAEDEPTGYGLGFWAIIVGMVAIGATAFWFLALPILMRPKTQDDSRAKDTPPIAGPQGQQQQKPGNDDGQRERENAEALFKARKEAEEFRKAKENAEAVLKTKEEADALRKNLALDLNAMLRIALTGKGTMEYVKTYAGARLPVWRKAADKGLAEGQFLLARCYDGGVGFPENRVEALRLYRMASEQGYAPAQNVLGLYYRDGEIGLKPNADEAVRWYRKAADQEYALAQYNLGVCYRDGEGVPQSPIEKIRWYRKSAEQGYALAQNDLGVAYYNGEGGLPKSQEEAVRWYRKAAEQGYTLAQQNLGICYYNGSGGLPKSPEVAVQWYRKAADQGYAMAQYSLGTCYYYGEGGLVKSPEDAVLWYRKAADQGNALAQNNLGACYYSGEGGLPKSPEVAVQWYRKAADLGNAVAQFNLGRAYEIGAGGLTKSPVEAVRWYRKAADQGYEPAKKALENK